MPNSEIIENLKKVRNRIEKACSEAGRDPSEVLLIAVSKTKSLLEIQTAAESGQLHFGENRMRELQDKMEEMDNPDIVWHMMGTMQSNKIKYIAPRVDWIHSVGKKKYLKEINKRAGQHNRTIQVLIQVNISGEDQKSGCEPADVPKLLDYAQKLDHVNIRGLMGIATLVENPEDVREEFALLRKILQENQNRTSENILLDHLSMGMTNDLEVAIEEGATMVRVGRAIFGERNYN